jgi:hypothetical protein
VNREARIGTEAYAKGGSQDVRLRAVAAVAGLERVLNALEGRLLDVGRIGRGLRLRFHRQDERFAWKRREGPRRWQEIGARIPEAIYQRLRIETRNRVDAIEHLIELRASGRRVLHLVGWWLEHADQRETDRVVLVWHGEDGGQVTWQFRTDGRMLRRGNFRAEAGPPAKYARELEAVMAQARVMQGNGERVDQIEGAVAELEAIDQRLAGYLGAFRGPCRLYHNGSRDTWAFHELLGSRRSRYLDRKAVLALVEQLSLTERGRVTEAVDLLDQRRQLKRMLGVAAVLAEAACRWPGGTWQLRGMRGENTASAWVAAITRTGLVARTYDGQQPQEKSTFDGRELEREADQECGGCY